MRGAAFVPVNDPAANPNVLRRRETRKDYAKIEKIPDRPREELRPKVAIAEVGAWTL